ncbi:MAG: PP2C family protein-serine/threonine phosphatase [Burkholderiales bacterium]
MNQYKIEAGAGQHIGDQSEQQDRTAFFVAPKAPGYMMAVLADGMGESGSGLLAAEQVIRSAKQNFDLFSPLTDTVETMLETIGREAHTIINMTTSASELRPRSTMVILVLTLTGSAVWAHVGDSRLYRFNGPNCAEHTIDHSIVELMVSENKLTREEAKGHRLSNLLVNVLGHTTGELFITIKRCDNVNPGDAFLLCSDGLWRYFDDAELGAAIAMNSPRQASEMLIKKARERAAGSFADNCSLAIVKLIPPPEQVKSYTVTKMDSAV